MWPGMVVAPGLGNPRPRTVYRLCGLSPPIDYGVHENNLTNLARGLNERVFHVEVEGKLTSPPRPEPGAFCKLNEFADRVVREVGMVAPCTREEFLALYAGDRRYHVYAKAVETLRWRDVGPKDAYMSTFVKAEKINFTAKSDPAPRVIQPRTPVYNVEVGRYVKRMEKVWCGAVGSIFGHNTILKGLNAQQVAEVMHEKWSSLKRPVAVGLDASRFDQHVSVEALQWEHSVYERSFYPQYRGALRKVLRWQLLNKGFGRTPDGVVKYQVEGCRMSGDMNTGLGNCLLMSAMVWQYCREVGVKPVLANNGDDCVVFLEEEDVCKFVGPLQEWFTRMGFTMKVEAPVRCFEEIEFCQSHPVRRGEGWVMCRDHLRAIAKDCVTVLPIRGLAEAQKWVGAIGACGMALADGVPVFSAFYRRLQELGAGQKWDHPSLETGMAMAARGMRQAGRVVGDAERISYWKAFGCLPSHQIALEHAFASAEMDLGSQVLVYPTSPVNIPLL